MCNSLSDSQDRCDSKGSHPLHITINQKIAKAQMLRDKLDGYVNYAAKVRYRLIHDVW